MQAKTAAIAMLLGLCANAAQAVPLSFTSTQYQTGASAGAGASLDANFDANPPSSFPLLTSASAAAGANSADAAGTADTGFLGASASAVSVDENANALGSAEFTGNFVATGGQLHIAIDFDSQADAGGGSADNTLVVHLTGNGIDFLNEMFSVTGLIDLHAQLPAGALGILDILLTSSADATGGAPFALTTASFAAASVPAAPTLALMLLALALLGMRRVRA
jgi:hypothetical protein